MINKSIFFFIIPFIIIGQTYDIKNNSKITYYGYHYTKNWEGASNKIRGKIHYDFTSNSVNNCSLRVNLSTFDSGNSNRDSNMLTYLEAFNYRWGGIYCREFYPVFSRALSAKSYC